MLGVSNTQYLYKLVACSKAMEEEAYILGYHKDDIDPYHKVTLLSTELDNSNDDISNFYMPSLYVISYNCDQH